MGQGTANTVLGQDTVGGAGGRGGCHTIPGGIHKLDLTKSSGLLGYEVTAGALTKVG